MSTRLSPLFDSDFFTRPWAAPAPAAQLAPMDAVRTGEALELRFDLPGYDPSSVDLSVDQRVLTLTAERRDDVAEGASVLVRERRHGSLTRRLRLSDSLDTSRVEARYDNGVLHVRIPVAEAAQAHKVDISIGSGDLVDAAVLEDGSSN